MSFSGVLRAVAAFEEGSTWVGPDQRRRGQEGPFPANYGLYRTKTETLFSAGDRVLLWRDFQVAPGVHARRQKELRICYMADARHFLNPDINVRCNLKGRATPARHVIARPRQLRTPLWGCE